VYMEHVHVHVTIAHRLNMQSMTMNLHVHDHVDVEQTTVHGTVLQFAHSIARAKAIVGARDHVHTRHRLRTPPRFATGCGRHRDRQNQLWRGRIPDLHHCSELGLLPESGILSPQAGKFSINPTTAATGTHRCG